MKKVGRAFAPANVSCIFKVYDHPDPRWAGSHGVGFTVNEGVAVTVQKASKTEIWFNGKKTRFLTVESVLSKLTKEKSKVEILSKLPRGCGFGLSGASALATAYAINELLHLKKTKKELAVIAHTAEVENKTGLGDVVNQYYGGFFVKEKPSSYFVVKRLPISNIAVYCRYFSKIATRTVLSDSSRTRRVNKAATLALMKIQKAKTFSEIISVAKEFAITGGMLKHKETKRTIQYIEKNGGHASMIMLGNAVFSDTPFAGAIRLKISRKGAYLL